MGSKYLKRFDFYVLCISVILGFYFMIRYNDGLQGLSFAYVYIGTLMSFITVVLMLYKDIEEKKKNK